MPTALAVDLLSYCLWGTDVSSAVNPLLGVILIRLTETALRKLVTEQTIIFSSIPTYLKFRLI